MAIINLDDTQNHGGIIDLDTVELPQNKSLIGDTGTSIKIGAEQLPGQVSGIADAAPARPQDKINWADFTPVEQPVAQSVAIQGDAKPVQKAGVTLPNPFDQFDKPAKVYQTETATPPQPDNSHTVAWGVGITVFVAVALLAWFKFKKTETAIGVSAAAQSPIHEQKEKSYAEIEPYDLQLGTTKGNAMSQNQKRILMAVLAIVAAMLVFPPFQVINSNGMAFNMGYGWIFDSPKRGSITANVNIPMLLTQWVGVLIVGGIAFFLAMGSPMKPQDSGSNVQNPGPSGVGGWLAFLVIALMILAPLFSISGVQGMLMSVEAKYPALINSSQWSNYKTVEWIAALMFSTLSFYGGYGLAMKRTPDVVSRAKLILWFNYPINAIVSGIVIPAVMLGVWKEQMDSAIGVLGASLLCLWIWTAYLNKSKRVSNTYGLSVANKHDTVANTAITQTGSTGKSLKIPVTASVSIVAILFMGFIAAIAIPAYHDYTLKKELASATPAEPVQPAHAANPYDDPNFGKSDAEQAKTSTATVKVDVPTAQRTGEDKLKQTKTGQTYDAKSAKKIIVELPDGKEVEFPDGTPDHVIQSALRRDFPQWKPKKSSGVEQSVAIGTKHGKTFFDCPACPEMVAIPAGSFVMGSHSADADSQNDEIPLHEVNVKAFALGKYEVTRGQFGDFIDETGDYAGTYWNHNESSQTKSQPVVYVNWNDAQAYAQWLSKKTGKQYRLPTEAEWEYAARAGTTTARYWGNDIGRNKANCLGCGSKWEEKGTAPVGRFVSNAFGLHDMIGNAWEWVEDSYHDSYIDAPTDGNAWSGNGAKRVVRGGAWDDESGYARAAKRVSEGSANRNNGFGFRLARTLP